jgi:hypothetical protein
LKSARRNFLRLSDVQKLIDNCADPELRFAILRRRGQKEWAGSSTITRAAATPAIAMGATERSCLPKNNVRSRARVGHNGYRPEEPLPPMEVQTPAQGLWATPPETRQKFLERANRSHEGDPEATLKAAAA